MINIDDFKKVEIKAGKIISAEPIEGSEKLFKLSVDFNEKNPRQVLSGIAKFIKPEDLIGTICAFVTNLEPREIMGLKSEAMIMALSGNFPNEAGEFFSLLKVSENIPPGSVVR
ncbi:MAG: hypothetical protein AAB350_02870 [Patescibacteria group bacterium]